MAKAKDFMDREWQSLGQVRDYLQQHTSERVESFNGFELITNKYKYGLASGQLRRTKL